MTGNSNGLAYQGDSGPGRRWSRPGAADYDQRVPRLGASAPMQSHSSDGRDQSGTVTQQSQPPGVIGASAGDSSETLNLCAPLKAMVSSLKEKRSKMKAPPVNPAPAFSPSIKPYEGT